MLLCSVHMGVSYVNDIDKSLLFAAGEGDSTEVARLLAEGADVNCVNEYGETPLHVSGIKGEMEVVNALLTAGANVNAQTHSGQSLRMTPLHWFVYPGYTEGVQALIGAGANVNQQNEDGKTPLDMCRQMGSSRNDIASLLVSAGAMEPSAAEKAEL
ncbi:hypothetical protein CYMTET_40750 [Cymbomonas tetramitiformis]|uniref:Ankyrin repeat domain-containing protein n=1 Tax=Cymbomonas tetramitiformis TaxID=36881 RepID=A0AAE0C9G9_9CHLO|nr:hypothetical protein CYMTET_40752 [Cymbomonas tetramitiformis]KAK3249842.1 hypothetical protein CYMTET_40750 [Cymbomonas tetramitiformis]